MVIRSASTSTLVRVAQMAVSLGPYWFPYRAAHPGQSPGSKRQRKDLTPHDDLHPRVALPSFFEQEPIHGGRSHHHGCGGSANLLQSLVAVTGELFLDQVQTGAEGQWHIDLETRHIKRDGGPGEHDVIRPQLQVLTNSLNGIGETSMGDPYPFRLARRTGGINHISEAIWGNRSCPLRTRGTNPL